MKFFILIFWFFSSSLTAKEDQYFTIDYKNLIAKKNIKDLIGDLNRGKSILSSRKVNCLSCHQAPIYEEKFQGNFGPSLFGVGSIYDRNELRLRIINAKVINPDSIMPSYYIKINNPRTPKKLLNKTILTAQEVEDLVEYLYSLKGL